MSAGGKIMGTSPIGPEGPHGSNEKINEPVTTKGGAAAKPKKVEEESGKAKPKQDATDIGPDGPH
jgi:hypothetical protein